MISIYIVPYHVHLPPSAFHIALSLFHILFQPTDDGSLHLLCCVGLRKILPQEICVENVIVALQAHVCASFRHRASPPSSVPDSPGPPCRSDHGKRYFFPLRWVPQHGSTSGSSRRKPWSCRRRCRGSALCVNSLKSIIAYPPCI